MSTPYNQESPTRYTLGDWSNKACVRVDQSQYQLPDDLEHQLRERHWFVPAFMPYLEHPEIRDAGASVVLRLEANHLVHFLDYTTVLEHKIVNRAVETLIHNELEIDVPQTMKNAALQLYTDEGYHALFSSQVAEHVAHLYGITHRTVAAHRISRLLHIVEVSPPADRALSWFLIGFVSETIIAKELLGAARCSLITTVYEMLKNHLADEARHSRYFSEVFSHVWSRLDDMRRSMAAKQLLSIIDVFFETDTYWLQQSLASVAITPSTIEHIVTQMQQPDAHQKRVRSGASATLMVLNSAGFFDSDSNTRLFFEAGFING